MEINPDFFTLQHNNIDPKKGYLLVSEPYAPDSFFSRSVVFLAEHNEDGSLGFVLNKPVDIPLDEMINDFPQFDGMVSLGGPVNSDRVYYIHTLGKELLPDSVHVCDGIFWGGDFDTLKSLILQGKVEENQVRFFIGYSGWDPKQLANEIKNNFWLVTKLDTNTLMQNDTKLWGIALNKIGGKYKNWKNMPENPALN